MKKIFSALIVLLTIVPLYQCKGQESSTTERYTYKDGDRNGTGKWYMGREIAHVMGFQGMSWLERPEREAEENTSILLKNMDIKPEDTIADIGAGSGYHVFQMAALAFAGHVYAIDIQEEMLEAIRQKMKRKAVDNISTIKGSAKRVNLAENSIDKILMVDVYHEFDYPAEMIASIKKALVPNGQIYLIEYRGEDENIPIKRLHKMTEAQAVEEMKAAGLKLEQNIDNLPWQHCMVFVKEE